MPMWEATDAPSGSSTTDVYAAGDHGTLKHPSIAKERRRHAGDEYRARRHQKTSRDLKNLEWRGNEESSDGEE